MTVLRIPKAILDRAERLEDLGIEELAWNLDDARDVLEHVRNSTVAVLGGDVYTKRSGRFEPTYENWYVDREPEEEPGTFAARSLQIARSYLEKLNRRDTGKPWIALVFSEPIEPIGVDEDL